MKTQDYQNNSHNRLDFLQIQTLDQEIQTQKSFGSFHFKRNELFSQVRKLLLKPQKRENQIKSNQMDKIISKYFRQSLNPIYEKCEKLPNKIFVCGNCKSLFLFKADYFKHTLRQTCPINHNRSTYLFYPKNSLTPIQSKDIQKTMKKEEFQLLQNLIYSRVKVFRINFQIRKKANSGSDTILTCGKCLRKLKIGKSNAVNHCLYICGSQNHKMSSHQFFMRYYAQSVHEFVEDISNLMLNYNFLTLFTDSYVRMQRNPKCKNKNFDFYCANCQISFQNSSSYLKHCLFDCVSRPSQQSSHLIKRRMVLKSSLDDLQTKIEDQIQNQNQIQIQSGEDVQKNSMQESQDEEQEENQVKKQDKKKEKKKHNKQEKQQQIHTGSKNQQIYKKINPRYELYENLFMNLYFCGSCLNHFQDSQLYLAHCHSFSCPINHQDNSHFYYHSQNSDSLNNEELVNFISVKSKRKIANDLQLLKKLNERYDLIDVKTNKIENKNYAQFKCGKCRCQYQLRFYFVRHVTRSCMSIRNSQNSHIFTFKKRQLTGKKFDKYILNLLFSFQIFKLAPSQVFSLKRNSHVKLQKKDSFLCGVCQSQFQNKYEYVYHCLSVCESLQNKQSSHFPRIITQDIDLNHCLKVVNEQQDQTQKLQSFPKTLRVSSRRKAMQQGVRQSQYKQIPQSRSQSQQQIIEIKNQTQKQTLYNKQEQIGQEQLQIIEQDESNESKAKSSEQKKEKDHRRFLFQNIDFDPNDKQKYHCDACQKGFKRQQVYIEHLNDCQNFENKSSSHFFISNDTMQKINKQNVMTNQIWFDKTSLGQYIYYESFNVVCGCGKTFLPNQFTHHIFSNHDFMVPKGSSHIIYRIIGNKRQIKAKGVLIPVKVSGRKLLDIFICPCNTNKKYQHEDFVRHVIKRHLGKTPICYMRRDLEVKEQQKICEQQELQI